MRTIEDEKFSWAIYDSWGFAPNLMRSGGATRNVATWRVLISGVNGMTLGFPAFSFQFSWVLVSKLFLSFTLIFCSEFYFFRLFLRLLQPCFGDIFRVFLVSIVHSSRYVPPFFLFYSHFLHNLFMSSWFFLFPLLLLLLCLIFEFLGFYSPIHGQFFWG